MSSGGKKIGFWAWIACGILIAIVIVAGALPLVLSRVTGGDFYAITASSMQPALMTGDVVLTEPMDQRPKRGEIVVFEHPQQPGTDYIKRVIGLAGDTVQMIDGEVHLNGTGLELRQVEDFEMPSAERGFGRASCLNNADPDQPCRVSQWNEQLTDGVSYRVLDLGQTQADNTQVFNVPERHVFVMGDNRDNSVDSRFPSLGAVPVDKVKYKAWLIHTSNDPDTSAPRWDRFFKRLDAE
ncbi:MAG: signal peptidase I [Pseudomonadota bacterium]